MLTIRSRVQPTGVWLMARLFRQKHTSLLRFSIRLVVGGEIRQVARGSVSSRFDRLATLVNRGALSFDEFERALREIGDASAFAGPVHETAAIARKALDALNTDFYGAPLPVFAETDFTLSGEAWAALLFTTITRGAETQHPVEIISIPVVGRRLPGSFPPRMVLPMNIEMPRSLADPLSRSTWFLEDAHVSEFGLRLVPADSALPLGRHSDIVVGDGRFISRDDALRWLSDRTTPARLRILVNVSFEPLWNPPLVQGTAAMLLPEGDSPGTDGATVWRLHQLFNALSHDRPLSFALHETRLSSERQPDLAGWMHGPRLYAGADVDQWFRLSNALPQAIQAATELYSVGVGASLDPFLDRLQTHVRPSPELEDVFLRLESVHKATQSLLRGALEEGLHFTYESSGLKPMSQMLAAKAAYDSYSQGLVAALEALRLQPGVTEALEEVQERKVDASLAVVGDLDPPRSVTQTQGVPAGRLIQLSVRIGQRDEVSLIVGDAPSLDPLLPELEGDEAHDIDIVVFEKDFQLVPDQSRTHVVRLGMFGGTAPVTWLLRAPVVQEPAGTLEPAEERQWKLGDIAELRFSLYFRNQLLQSFDLQTTLVNPHAWEPPPGKTGIRCDFSQTRRFGSLDALGDRLINLSLNEGENGRHTLAIKGDGFEPAAVTWDSGLLSTRVDALRDAVFRGMVKNGSAAFLFDAANQALEPLPAGTFESAVQEMAEAGSALRQQLFLLDSPTLQEALTRAKRSMGQTIQVALLRANYTLPWGLLYDFKMPDIKAGVPAQVCRGRDEQGADCTCKPGDGTKICLRGFWGFRHLVEQLCGTRDPRKDVGRIGPKRTTPLMGFIRTLSDDYTTALSKLFEAEGTSIKEYPNPRSFLQLLENEATRPALVLYVGHQDVEGPAMAPTPKLLTYDKAALLRLSDLVDSLEDKKTWHVPRSLVLLLGCATGAARVDTGIGLAGALLQLGAVGVVGTECTVYSDIVARVARDLRRLLFSGKSIGDALHQITWDLAEEGCPMGLAFTYLGPIEAGLPP